MRILSILALAAMTFGFVSCAKKTPAPLPTDGKSMHRGYSK